MKKIALTSLLAVFAASAASAANVDSPLYMPKAGHAYSDTTLATHSENGRVWALGERFGYGVSDKTSVFVDTTLAEKAAFDMYGWTDLSLGVAHRFLNNGAWKADFIGVYTLNSLYDHPALDGQDAWFDKDVTTYSWTAGVRGGYVGSSWTIAGHALYNYLNTESFNWGNHGMHSWALGLDAQYIISSHWNLLAGVEYKGITNDHYYMGGIEGAEIKNAGRWTGSFGVNYDIDAAKYVGLYINGEMNHQGGDNHDKWAAEKGFGIAAKFGVDF